MDIIISNASQSPIYEQIIDQIKGLILSGRLREGEALPSIRLLAKELRISVITVKRAYDDLEQIGFIETVAGKGSFVARKNMEILKEENLRQIEELLSDAAALAKRSGLSLKELCEIMEVLYDGQ